MTTRQQPSAMQRSSSFAGNRGPRGNVLSAAALSTLVANRTFDNAEVTTASMIVRIAELEKTLAEKNAIECDLRSKLRVWTDSHRTFHTIVASKNANTDSFDASEMSILCKFTGLKPNQLNNLAECLKRGHSEVIKQRVAAKILKQQLAEESNSSDVPSQPAAPSTDPPSTFQPSKTQKVHLVLKPLVRTQCFAHECTNIGNSSARPSVDNSIEDNLTTRSLQ